MCGIAGIGGRLTDPQRARDTVARMLATLRHRGPDDEGILATDGAVLGHRRLSIIDLSTGQQPMCNEDGSLWVVFNGEIYDFADLRDELTAAGHAFSSRSDTEVILHAYEQWGQSFLDRLHGMFGFALWDCRTRQLILARDRMGIKPVYYAVVGEAIIFASELKAFRVIDELVLGLDLAAVDQYLALRYVPAPLTMLAGVRKLGPGECLTWQAGRVRIRRYWTLGDVAPFEGSEHEGAEAIRATLRRSVQSHLVADVPVGVFLSGGLDSSIVTSQVKALGHAGIKAFGVCLDLPGGADERPWADLVARETGADFYPLAVSPSEYMEGLEPYSWQCDDLVADSASYLLYRLSGLTRQHVKVVLSGEGADELFAGYGYEAMDRVWQRQQGFNKLPPVLARTLRRINQASIRWARAEAHLKTHRLGTREWLCEMRGPQGKGFSWPERDALYAPGSGLTAYSISPISRAALATCHSDELLDCMLYQDTRVWLPDNLLNRADRMTMAHGLELRVPFLDDSVVALASSFPGHWKLRQEGGVWRRKWILRQAFAQAVPKAVLDRPKMGFQTDFHRLFEQDAAGRAKQIFRESRLSRQGLFEPTELDRLTRTTHPLSVGAAQKLLTLMLLFFWYERMFAESS